MSSACRSCLTRAWLLGRLAGHLDRARAQIDEVLVLSDSELIAAVGGARRQELERSLAGLRLDSLRRAAAEAGLESICRCAADYPRRLNELRAPPAVLFVAGDRELFRLTMAGQPVAVVGSRRASSYGLETARSLARGLAAAGMVVISGMALGIDSAAHTGALSAEPAGVAVLPGPAHVPYPPSSGQIHRRLITKGAVISELPPDTSVHRWAFVARNRIIAALSAVTVVVEAATGSGALVTAAVASELGRPVGAVPGRITTPQAAGTNALLAEGAFVVRGAQDVLDAAYGIGVRTARTEQRPELTSDARAVLRAVAAGNDSAEALRADTITPGRTLAALAWLELSGYVRREAGGRFAVIP